MLTWLNVFLLISCFLILSDKIRSTSSSQFSIETLDDVYEDEIFSENNNIKIRNTIKNKINKNNRYRNNKGSSGYRDL